MYRSINELSAIYTLTSSLRPSQCQPTVNRKYGDMPWRASAPVRLIDIPFVLRGIQSLALSQGMPSRMSPHECLDRIYLPRDQPLSCHVQSMSPTNFPPLYLVRIIDLQMVYVVR